MLWKVEIPVYNEEELQNLTLQDNEALHSAMKIRHYWDCAPPENNIHLIIKPPTIGKYYQVSFFRNQLRFLNHSIHYYRS